MRPRVLLILDGLGDCPVPTLGALTPLEAAQTPWMNELASRGACGVVDPLSPGVRVGTHVGAGVLMGLHPDDARRLRRGPVEAAGIGLAMASGDVAFRCNLATLREEGRELYVVDRRAGRCSEGNEALCTALDGIRLPGDVVATLRPATGHRAVLRLSGPDLSDRISDSDPGDGAPLPCLVNPCRASDPADPGAGRTSVAVSRLLREAFERLGHHPANLARERDGLPVANGILTRGAGKLLALRNSIREAGLRAAVISAESTVIGLGRLFGFTTITGPGMTADTRTDLDAKVASARAALADHDVVFVHVKGTDLCAHDRLPDEKRSFLERIDAALAPMVGDDVVVAVSGDHSTDSNTGMHTADPVPSLICRPGNGTGGGAGGGAGSGSVSFGERQCESGSLGRLSATDFLRRFLAYR